MEQGSIDDWSVKDHSCLGKPYSLNTVGVQGCIESVVIV